MSSVNGKITVFVVILCMIFIFNLDPCDAGKDNKHKHKNDNQKNNGSHKNSTTAHHKNSTAGHDASGNHTGHGAAPPPIGWSLHNDASHPAPAPNPHGYAVHHNNHPGSLDAQTSGHHPGGAGVPAQGAPGQHHDALGTPNQQHGMPIQQHNQPQANANQPQESGTSALGAGLGGLALGAIGGAAGGYLLSNALNSGDKSSEKTEANETISEAATTLAAAETSLAALTNVSSAVESTSEAAPNNGTEADNIASIAPVEGIKVQNAPIEATSTTVDPSSDLIKSEQKTVGTPEAKSSAFVRGISQKILAFCVLSSVLLAINL